MWSMLLGSMRRMMLWPSRRIDVLLELMEREGRVWLQYRCI